MDLSNLKPAEGATHNSKRIGRGEGTGKGGTSTKGHKGAQSRTGYSRRIGFEGGQMPLQRRLPKFGFKNPNRKDLTAINLDRLEEIAAKYNLTEINPETLRANNIISKTELFKILSRGELSSKLTIKANGCSEKAKTAVESAGGSVEIV